MLAHSTHKPRRATVGAKDLSRGLSRRERARKLRRERGLSERPPGGEGAVWPPVDDPLEELTELVWPSSELPALVVQLSVEEVRAGLDKSGGSAAVLPKCFVTEPLGGGLRARIYDPKLNF